MKRTAASPCQQPAAAPKVTASVHLSRGERQVLCPPAEALSRVVLWRELPGKGFLADLEVSQGGKGKCFSFFGQEPGKLASGRDETH